MSKKVRKYSQEFKAEATKLALRGGSVLSTAKELGIPEATLYTWVNKAKGLGEQACERPNGEISTIHVGDVLEENRQLRKRMARLEQEKEILKKAAAYFAKELL